MEQPAYSQRTEGGKSRESDPRSSISIAMPGQQQTSCYTKGSPHPTLFLPSVLLTLLPLCSPLSHSNPFYTPVVKGAVSAVCKVTLLLPCGRNHSELIDLPLCLRACVCVHLPALFMTEAHTSIPTHNRTDTCLCCISLQRPRRIRGMLAALHTQQSLCNL